MQHTHMYMYIINVAMYVIYVPTYVCILLFISTVQLILM